MHRIARFVLTALALTATPLAHAGEAFVNGQAGRISLDGGTPGKDSSHLLEVNGGYRWGIGPFKAGLEGGIGRIGETDGHRDVAGTRHAYNARSSHFTIGANARIKPPLMPVQFIGRAGYVALRSRIEQDIGGSPANASTHTHGGTYIGAGIGTTLLPLLDVTLMVNQYQLRQVEHDAGAGGYRLSGDKRDATSVALAVEYRF